MLLSLLRPARTGVVAPLWNRSHLVLPLARYASSQAAIASLEELDDGDILYQPKPAAKRQKSRDNAKVRRAERRLKKFGQPDSGLNQLPSRQRTASPATSRSAGDKLHTEQYIRHNYGCPSAAEYGLSEEPIDCMTIFKEAGIFMEARHSKHQNSKLQWKCTLKVELDNDHLFTGLGHATTSEMAQKNAALHVASILHDKGLFRDVLPRGKYCVISEDVVRLERTARSDVYNYAARYGFQPVFHEDTRRSAIKPSFKTTHAYIKELNLHGVGRARSAQEATQKAAIALKYAAERHHLQEGDGLLLVKDYTILGSHNAKQFVEFICYRKRLNSELNVKERASRWSGIVTISDKFPSAEEDGTDKIPDRTFNGPVMAFKQEAEHTAYLVAAQVLKTEDDDSWQLFVKEMKRGDGVVLKNVRPITLSLGNEVVETMHDVIDSSEARELNESDANPVSEETSSNAGNIREYARAVTSERIAARSQILKEALDEYRVDPSTAQLRSKREELPMLQYREQLQDIVAKNDVCVVVGATGSGKTTQLPQIILEQMIEAGSGGACNIICTQPRRIAATSVAQRVASERNESLGQTVGYSVRFSNKSAALGGSINFCTTGILLRQLQDSKDQALQDITHLIIDEVHERDVQIDFLLVTLRELIADRRERGLPQIKIILMSATIDTDLFCKYFGAGFADGRCPYIEVPGRTFPVQTHFLDEIYSTLKHEYAGRPPQLSSPETTKYIDRELVNPPDFQTATSQFSNDADEEESSARIDWNAKGVVKENGELDLMPETADAMCPIELMSVTISHLVSTTTTGSILVFLPGLSEILALNKILTTERPLGIDFANNDDYKVYMLHSAIPQMQQEVFEKLPAGKRKIILSTNIAETSITIPDVVYVVDSGKHREAQYDPAKRISSLVSSWISKSNAKQRAGRAGRVQNGHYYTMASEARADSLQTATLPGILRTDLQELCLQIKSMNIPDIGKFLSQAIEPPPAATVANAIQDLQNLNALDFKENLTPLGRLLSLLPVAPALGKMVLLGLIFKCLDPILILAAAASHKDIFVNPLTARAEADANRLKWSEGSGSDHVATINAFTEWRVVRAREPHKERDFAFKNFLHRNTLRSIAQTCEQMLDIMQKAGLLGRQHGTRGMLTNYGNSADNENSHSLALQSALTAGGLYPNIAVQTPQPRVLRTISENSALIHPSSLAAPKSSKGRYGPVDKDAIQPPGTLYAFSNKTKNDAGQVSLRGTAKASSMSVLLFGGEKTRSQNIITVDDWIPFYTQYGETGPIQEVSGILDAFLRKTFAQMSKGGKRRLNSFKRSPAADYDAEAEESIVQNVVKIIELTHVDGKQESEAVSTNTSTSSEKSDRAFRPRGRLVTYPYGRLRDPKPLEAKSPLFRPKKSRDSSDLTDMLELLHKRA